EPGRPNRWWASITSRPLFIRVAESTEIFGPIDHLGWATAWAGVTSANEARLRPRNGPPEAVSTIRRTSWPRQARRHWNTALCSLSIGTMVAPASRAAAITSSPASTSDSLLASSRRLPARAAARVEPRPAAPTIAATTVSQSSPAASASIACAPPCAVVARPASRSPARRTSRREASAIAAWAGRWVAHSCTSASTLLPAASTLASRRSGWRAQTSTAGGPIDPVAPTTATFRVTACTSGTGMSEAQDFLAQREGRQCREHAVHAVEQSAVAGNQVAGILHARLPLEQALEQVAHHAEQHGDQRGQGNGRQRR